MPAFVPSALTLLQAAADDLERDVLPALAGFPRFRTRVVINALRLVSRELAHGDAADAAEHARLLALLCADASEGIDELRGRLARAIEVGDIGLDDEGLVFHLKQGLREALAIDSPGWITEA